MSIVDVIILAALVLSLVFGYVRGFVRQLVSFFGWVAAYAAAYLFYDDIAPFIRESFPLSESVTFAEYEAIAENLQLDDYVYYAIAFALLFFGGKLLLWVIGYFLQGVASLPGIRSINQWSGALLGFVEAAIIVIIALLVMDALPYERTQQWLQQSQVFVWLDSQLPVITERVTMLWQD